FVINPKFSPMELLASICDELHLDYTPLQPSIKEYIEKLFAYLIDAHSRGRNTVLVIDEAQNLSVEALEHVRALTNLETNEQKLLQIILIGQPELKTLLAKPELEQVDQRITARFHIGPLSLNETNRYINHRLFVAGAKQKIFSIANIKQIYRFSKGVPRRINILCDRILLGAYTIRKSKITSQIIKQSAEEVFGNVPLNESVLPKALAASVAVFLISGVAAFAFTNYSFNTDKLPGSLSSVVDENTSLKITDKSAAMLKENKKEQLVVEENNTEEKIQQEPKDKVAIINKKSKSQIDEQIASFKLNNNSDRDGNEKELDKPLGLVSMTEEVTIPTSETANSSSDVDKLDGREINLNSLAMEKLTSNCLGCGP
ncbi:MAG: AAA family ATPase, partial [Gammaproteobacteria bacterium]